MLASISWTEFLVTVTIIVTIFYLYVLIRYYRTELKKLFATRHKNDVWDGSGLEDSLDGIEVRSDEVLAQNENLEETGEEFFEKIEQLVGRLKRKISDSSGRSINEMDLKVQLHLVLVEYPEIKESALRSSVNETVVATCKEYDVIALNEEEVDMLW